MQHKGIANEGKVHAMQAAAAIPVRLQGQGLKCHRRHQHGLASSQGRIEGLPLRSPVGCGLGGGRQDDYCREDLRERSAMSTRTRVMRFLGLGLATGALMNAPMLAALGAWPWVGVQAVLGSAGIASFALSFVKRLQ